MAFVIDVKWRLWTVETITLYKVFGRYYVLGGIYYSVLSTLPANTTLTQYWSNAGPQSVTMAQHQITTVSTPRVCCTAFNPVNTKYYCVLCGVFWNVLEI